MALAQTEGRKARVGRRPAPTDGPMTWEEARAFMRRDTRRNFVRRPHWHPHSYLFIVNKRVPRFFTNHRPYFPKADHSRVFEHQMTAEEVVATDWIKYEEPR